MERPAATDAGSGYSWASLVEFLDAQRSVNEVMQSYNDTCSSYARGLYLIDSVSAATQP